MILKAIKNIDTVVYLQIWENRIRAFDSKTGKVFDEVPLLAIETNEQGQKVVLAVGNAAENLANKTRLEVVNPFSHPRLLLGDFYVAEKLVQHVFRELFDKTWLTPSPRVVIHPMEKNEGGLTQVEEKAFREMALGAGAREVLLYSGTPLPCHAGTSNAIDFAALEQQMAQKQAPQRHMSKHASASDVSLLHVVVLALIMGAVFWYFY